MRRTLTRWRDRDGALPVPQMSGPVVAHVLSWHQLRADVSRYGRWMMAKEKHDGDAGVGSAAATSATDRQRAACLDD
jgi:hypothetical protein